MSVQDNPINKNNSKVEEIKLLSEDCIKLWQVSRDDNYDAVPPSSPQGDLNYTIYDPLPITLPNVRNLKIPYVREIGVKTAIETLADHFQCNNYRINLLHFWFLDIITDCLWKAQEEFDLPESDQKIVLQWIIFLFNLIKGNLSSSLFTNFSISIYFPNQFTKTNFQ